jgi:hypothetical protein
MNEIRKRVWVDPFQTKLFFRVATYWLIYTLTLFNLLFAWRLLTEGPGDLWQQLCDTAYANIPLFLAFVMVGPWIALDSVKFANRLVGPLYRFRKTMQSVTANEKVRPIRLRQDDFLTDMQDDFNAMLEAVEQRGGVRLEQPAEKQTATGR